MNYKQSYRSEGYCTIPSIIDEESRAGFREVARQLILKVATHKGLSPKCESEDYVLHELICQVYEEHPQAGGFLYDTLSRHLRFYRVYDNLQLNTAIADLLGCDSTDDLAVVRRQLVLDPPGSEFSALGWHQDAGYYADLSNADRSLVAWIPLFDCGPADGGLWVVPGSQKPGILEHVRNPFEKRRELAPDKRGEVYLESEYFDATQAVQLDVRAGDLVLTDMNLVHKSGRNLGERVRYTFLGRYANIMGKGYLSQYEVW